MIVRIDPADPQFRFKVEIEFNGRMVVQKYLNRRGREEIWKTFREAANTKDDCEMEALMATYGRAPHGH